MATIHRTTILAFWTAFYAHMKMLEGTSNPKYEEVAEGEASTTSRPTPFILVQLLSAEVRERLDNGRLWLCKMRVRVVSIAAAREVATSELLTRLSEVENHIQAFKNPKGVTGAGSESWSFTFSILPDAGSHVQADSIRSYSVMVENGAN